MYEEKPHWPKITWTWARTSFDSVGLLVNQLVSSMLHFDFNSALQDLYRKWYIRVYCGILGSWVPANLKGCSRAEDFDTKWVHIKKTGALWSVYDGSPEQKYSFIGKVLWSNLIPRSRGSSSSSFRFFFSCHHLPEGVDLKNLHTFQRLRDDYPSRFGLIFRKFLNLKIQKFSLQNFGV